MDALEPGSDLPLEQHLNDVKGAMAAMFENQNIPAAFRNAGAPNAFTDAVLTAPFKGVSLFVALADSVGGANSGNHMKQSTNSIFVSEHQQQMQQRRPMPTPLMPLTYKEKVALAKGGAKPGRNPLDKSFSAFASERLALIVPSLTGGGAADGKKTPIKGIKVSPEAAAAMGSSLAMELANTLNQMEGTRRWENNPKRLMEGLKRNDDRAKEFVEKNKTNPNTLPSPGFGHRVTKA